MPNYPKMDSGPEGINRPKAAEDDTEGHSFMKATPEGINRPKAAEDDTEGHSFLPDPTTARQLAQARERDIQRHLKERAVQSEARRPFKRG